MKVFFSFACFVLSVNSFSQNISWANSFVKEKSSNPEFALTFPGVFGNNYYVMDVDRYDATLIKKVINYIQRVDVNSMTIQTDFNMSSVLEGKNIKDLGNAQNFVFKDKVYSFYIDKQDDKIYKVYSTIQDARDGALVQSYKNIQAVDITKTHSPRDITNYMTTKREQKKYDESYAGHMAKHIKPAYDAKSIISAYIYATVDADNSMLNISEWDEDLKVLVSNNYKIPFKRFDLKGFSSESPFVMDFVKDRNGFFYVLTKSANSKNENDTYLYSVYQFRLNDPSYMKVFKKEFSKNIASKRTELFQDESGKIYLSNIGYQSEEGIPVGYNVNKAFIGRFSETGELETIFSNNLSAEMMYNFETEKTIDKKGAVNSLNILNILTATNGGCYVIWEHQWTESNANSRGGSNYTIHNDNALIQYFNRENKMLWQKPVFKQQEYKGTGGWFTGMASFVLDDELHLFYPDDKKNADKPIDYRDVSQFSIAKFGTKDHAGIFSATMNIKGDHTRKYIYWPEDKIGYAFCVESLKYAGNKQFIGTARRIKQGAVLLKAEDYIFFKLLF